jgi:uncharacterized RDD family membrane protein YckC
MENSNLIVSRKPFSPMHTVQVHTAQNIPVEFELGSLGDRILGRILDGLFILAYVAAWVLILVFSHLRDQTWIAGTVIIGAIPILFYDLVLEATCHGQSLGKKIMHIRVISLDGKQPAFSQYLIRWLFRLVDFSLTENLCALLCVALNPRHQRLGDMVAGTVVIRTRARSTEADTLYVPLAQDYQARYPEAAGLSDSDVRLIKEVLAHYARSGNLVLLHDTAEKVRQTLGLPAVADPASFLQTILTDYNYLATQD